MCVGVCARRTVELSRDLAQAMQREERMRESYGAALADADGSRAFAVHLEAEMRQLTAKLTHEQQNAEIARKHCAAAQTDATDLALRLETCVRDREGRFLRA